jgi:carbon monoxide dehydrogenase subunit G
MKFSNSLDVSLPPAEAWKTLMDIPRIARCMPGAELTEVVDAQTYKGKVAVRMGPVVLAFAGTAKFEERNDETHSARVRAQGLDAKGRGRASAAVNFRLDPSGSGSKVLIDTDLNLSGSVAQYARGAGMIQTIAAELINQFAKSLEQQIVQAAPATIDTFGAKPADPKPRIRPEPIAQPVAQPIGGLSLVAKALWAGFTGLFRGKYESNR